MSYTKLFNSILTSTIWVESDRTRIVWITMLALADKHGEVQASVPGLARVAGVPLEDCEAALNKFLSPDQYSRTPDDEGRRIEVIPGGWLLLNHAKYRALASREEAQEAAMIRQRRRRARVARNQPVTQCHASVTPSHACVTQDLHIAEAEAEADTEAVLSLKGELVGADAPPAADWANCAELLRSDDQIAANAKEAAQKPQTDDEWLAGLAASVAYAGIDVPREYAKMQTWCATNRKQATRRRFINWLNRIEKPMTGAIEGRASEDVAKRLGYTY